MIEQVIFLILPDVEILDLAGPLQTFAEANRDRKRYRLRLCGPDGEVRSDQGLSINGLEPLMECGKGDLIVVPGMPYASTRRVTAAAVRWLAKSASHGAAFASVCTGAFILGDAGLLDGRTCTTHWSRTADLQARFPRAEVLTSRLWVSDGPITTSAGIASGIDMSLAIIERELGPLTTAAIAREMVVYLRRDGSQGQQSAYLDYRTHLHPGVHRVQDWITQHPADSGDLTRLADIAGLSTRHLTRLFRQSTGVSIKDFTTRVRMELAGKLLHDPTLSVDAVAGRCGFSGARHLRRLWLKEHGTTPSAARFS